MPNRNQIIVISVLALIALLIGYFKNPLNLSMGKRAEAGGPIAPTRTLTLEEKKVVGTYEFKRDTNTYRLVFLDNFKSEHYVNRQKPSIGNWSIVGIEIHIVHQIVNATIYRMNPDNSITHIADIRDGKRTDLPKENQPTYKKIEPTLEVKDIVGTYQIRIGTLFTYIFYINGIMEHYINGKKQNTDYKWSIVDNEVHRISTNNDVVVYTINPDKSITNIATIRNEKRIVTSKDNQNTLIKIN